jgi:hypothetical protein
MASLGSWPAAFVPVAFRLTLQTNQRVNAAPGGGSEQALDMLNDRWVCSMTLPVSSEEDGAAMEAFLASFRGQVNTVDLWHFLRPVPRGTLRNTPNVNGDHAQGSATLALNASVAGDTLKAGDLIGVSGLLLMVAADCTSDGSGHVTVPLVNRLRKAITSGTSVVWNEPTAPFRLLSNSGVEYAQGLASEVDLTLGEAI